MVTENRDQHDNVEVGGGKITKKSTPDESHQGSEHVSKGKIALSPDVQITPPRPDEDPLPAEIEEAEEEEDEEESKEEGESHERIDDDGDDDNTNEEAYGSMIRRKYRV